MKPIVISILAICALCFTNVNAQTTFAPAGAEWYHDMGAGVFHCYNAGDSLIFGKTCSSIRQKALVKEPYYSQGLLVYDRPTLYTFASGDTVFIYNNLFSKFTPLYIFNVSDGDTVRIPTFYKPMGATTFDTTFSYVVDSVRNILYDTTLLKTVYTRSLRPASWSGETTPTYGLQWEDFGAYAERIGNVKIGIFPRCYGCPIPTSDSYQEPGAVRCYNDPLLSVKLVPGICGIPSVSINDLKKEQSVAVYPNPANDVINISIPTNSVVKLIAIDGREVITTKVDGKTNSTISTVAIPAGIYLLKVIDEDKAAQYMRMQIVH